MALKGLLLKLGVSMSQSKRKCILHQAPSQSLKKEDGGASRILAFQTGVEQPSVGPGWRVHPLHGVLDTISLHMPSLVMSSWLI